MKSTCIYLIMIVLLSVTQCSKLDNDVHSASSTTKAVVISDNTAVRIDPYIFSSRVTNVNKGTIVTIIDISKEKQWVGGQMDYWYKVSLRNTIKGWIFGSSLALQIDASDAAIERYINSLWKKEADTVRNAIAGKWWSVNKSGDFTEHALELYPDGSYKSYKKGTKAIEGSYSLNFRTSEVVFLDGTSFNKNLYFMKRGNSYQLAESLQDAKIEFKKIAEFKDSMPNIAPETTVSDTQEGVTPNDQDKNTNQ
ncbi:MAG: SH3 domain-containing protein [Spirochaetota bacterium]